MPIAVKVQGEIVRIVWEGSPTDSELERFFEDLTRAVAHRSHYALLYDARQAAAPSTRQRHLLADLSGMMGPALRDRCAGAAFVIDSWIVRAALTGILWMRPMEVPHVVTASVTDAEAWCHHRLAPAAKSVRQ
ncbi:MAG: STAS/SEC14 domain-containing protein [Polyangiales bacterium]